MLALYSQQLGPPRGPSHCPPSLPAPVGGCRFLPFSSTPPPTGGLIPPRPGPRCRLPRGGPRAAALLVVRVGGLGIPDGGSCRTSQLSLLHPLAFPHSRYWGTPNISAVSWASPGASTGTETHAANMELEISQTGSSFLASSSQGYSTIRSGVLSPETRVWCLTPSFFIPHTPSFSRSRSLHFKVF